MPRLRPAIRADHDVIARIWLESWRSVGLTLVGAPPDYAGLRARIEQEVDDGWQVTVAQRDGGVAGFAALNPPAARLEQLFVDPAVLGQGIGTALMAHAAAAMPGGFHLWTHGDNMRAQRFYEARAPLRWEDGVHPRRGHPIRTYWFAGAR